MVRACLIAVFLAVVASASSLESARDRQDIGALQKAVAETGAAAEKAQADAGAQYQSALACSYLAEVLIEQRDRKQARRVAEQGIRAAEKAVSLKPDAENHR